MTVSPLLPDLKALVDLAVLEDLGSGDVTTKGCVPGGATMRAHLMARSQLVVAGLPWLEQIFGYVRASVNVQISIPEGAFVPPGTLLASLTGSAQDILTYERIVLNILYVSCGIATTTHQYVKQLEGSGVQLLDTRKTWPGLRALSKYATHMGGAVNHRMGLYDGVMIKDNHRGYIRDLTETVRGFRQTHPALPIIYECDSLGDVENGLRAGVDHLLLDNMSPERVRAAVLLIQKRAAVEASGGITLENLWDYAQTGVDYLSSSAITMNPGAVDLGLDEG